MSGRRTAGGYLPINAYGVVGDCRSAALIGTDGSVDWMCLPRFDDPSLFGRLLDSKRGGSWQVRPAARHLCDQRYRDRTNVLVTTFTTSGGVASVTDFMPIDAPRINEHAKPHNEARLIRIVECLAGEVEMESICDPAPNYGAGRLRLHSTGKRLHGDTDEHHVCIQSTIDLERHHRFTLRGGEAAALGLRMGRAGHCSHHHFSLDHALGLLRTTQAFWWMWADGCTYDGPFREHVVRSALALKLMTYTPTGAIVAAPTTSLPELIGSYHNYDYRFTWLRDAAFTLYAFFQLGLYDEADSFWSWLRRIGLSRGDFGVANLYDLDGSPDVPEKILRYLSGYRGSQPVRIGNMAVDQLQLDVYGELLDSAYLYARFGGTITPTLWDDLRPIVDLAVMRWPEPDRSIWEPRTGDQHFTYSKLMCWVAVDRGLRIAERFNLPHAAKEWRAARKAIHQCVMDTGYNAKLGAFTQVLGGDTVDASILRMSQARFLRDKDPRMLSTVKAVAEQLSDGGVLVRRFRRAADDAGKRSREGSFLLCSFWLADALAHVGELEEAERLFERLLVFGSPLGLFSEEADAVNGAALGNFPQAFTHLALVGAAVNIERARHKTLGRHGLRAG